MPAPEAVRVENYRRLCKSKYAAAVLLVPRQFKPFKPPARGSETSKKGISFGGAYCYISGTFVKFSQFRKFPRLRRRGLSGNFGRWSPAASVLLLVLFAHAFLVNATHCHRFARSSAPGTEHGSGLSGREDTGRPTEAGGDAQCVLCRLQRNFVTDFQRVSTPVGPARQECQRYCQPPALSNNARAFSVPQGRAPPLA
jgi:hypothetical protein